MSLIVKDVLDALQQMQKSLECSICLELLKDPHSTKCNHQFCGHCIKQVLEKSSKKSKYKWYCPLCKTPVSKRSLTPNPRLNEIAAAVRNLQGAIQEDTGIPTGSPPSQPLKPLITVYDKGSVDPDSIHCPTPQKCVSKQKNVGQKVSRRKNPFSIYVDDNDDADHSLQNKKPEAVSNVNIRSMLGPISTEKATNSTKSKKSFNTRQTRSSRRTAPKNLLKENTNGNSVNEELLHMIDTLPFQPLLKAGSTSQAIDGASMAGETEQYHAITTNQGSSQLVESECLVNCQTIDCKGRRQIASGQPKRAVCSKTVAEADSSMKTSPRDNSVFIENKISLSPTLAPVPVKGDNNEDEGAVSSTKCEYFSPSSLDTMQSVSILPSQDCLEHRCDVVVGEIQVRNQEEASPKREEFLIEGVSESEAIKIESSARNAQEGPLLTCKNRRNNDNVSPQSLKKGLQSEGLSSSSKNRAQGSLDFESLVSLFDDPFMSKDVVELSKADESSKQHPDTSQHEEETFSSIRASFADCEESRNQAAESDLCERVKMRRRRRTSEIPLPTNKRSEASKKSLQLRTKTKKRCAESAATLTSDDQRFSENTRKKLKQVEDPFLNKKSPFKDETKELQKDEENSEEMHTNGMILLSVKHDEQAQEYSTFGSDSSKTVLSSEIIQASVSSSDISPATVINPMIAHVDQGGENLLRRKETEGSNSQRNKENDQSEVSKHNSVIESRLRDDEKTRECPQIKLILDRNKENQANHETQDQESAYKEEETGNEKRKHREEEADWSGSKQEASKKRHQQPQSFYSKGMSLTASGHQGLPVQKEVEEHESDLVNTTDSSRSLLELELKQKDHLTSSFTWHSQEHTATEVKEIVDGFNCKFLDEAQHLTSQKLSQKGQFSGDTPTQSSLEFLDAMTPCLFGNDGLETSVGNQNSPLKTTDSRTPSCSDGETEEENSLDMQKDGCLRGISRDSIRVEYGNAEREKVVDLAHCPNGIGEVTSNTDETQSFETSQSISVLHGLEFPPHDQSQDSTNCSENIPDLGRSSQHFQKQSEDDAPRTEPPPKKTRKIEMISTSQDDTYSDISLRPGSGPIISKSRESECMECEVIPPTPLVKPVTKHALSNLDQSHSRLSHPNSKLHRNNDVKSRLENPVVKRNRRSKSPRVSKSATSSSTCSSTSSEQSENSTSLLKNLETIVPDFSKEFESSQGRKPGNAITEWDATPSQSPDDFEINKNFCDKTLPDRCVSQDKTFSQSSYNEIRSDVLNSKERACKNLGDMPCPDAEKSNSSPQTCSLDRQKVHGDVQDSFSWTGTEHKRNSQISPVPSYNDIAHKNTEDVIDVFKHKLREASVRDSGEQDCFHGDYDEGDISLGDDGRRKNPFGVRNEGDALASDNEVDSSSDEVLLMPVFLPKSSESYPNDNCSEDDEDDEEELQFFSQELIPSDGERYDDNDDDGISSCKALDSTGASSATVLSEAAASTQKMEVLRQDVEAMEKEMDELRAYLAETDEQQKEGNIAIDDDVDCMEEDPRDSAIITSSLTPPPPLTPKSIPPMRQLSSPLKNASRYLNQEGQSSDEDEDIAGEEITTSIREEYCELRNTPCNGKENLEENENAVRSRSRKRALSPSHEDDGLSITAVGNRQDKTPSPPRSSREIQKSQERDEGLIVIDDRDPVNSKTGSLLLVKRRKVVDELVPRKSPVVSLLFTRKVKDVNAASHSPISHGLAKGLSPIKKRSPFIYSRKRSAEASTISGRNSTGPLSHKTASREDMPHDRARVVTRDARSQESTSRDSLSADGLLIEGVSRAQCRLSDETFIELSTATNTPESPRNRKKDNSRSEKTKPPSFVATRLNRKQLAEARVLAETYGGKLASEFNSKTTHVIMATDENMQVTRHSYTMKYLLGLALGKWIVSHRWITACIAAKALVAEADYEVRGDAGLGQTSIPCLARTARSKKEALLFEDFHVLCFGKFSAAVAKDQLSQLLKFCGARVFSDVENLKRIGKDGRKVVVLDKDTKTNIDHLNAVCRHLNTIPVSLEWVTDSIANYKVQDLKDYAIKMDDQRHTDKSSLNQDVLIL